MLFRSVGRCAAAGDPSVGRTPVFQYAREFLRENPEVFATLKSVAPFSSIYLYCINRLLH